MRKCEKQKRNLIKLKYGKMKNHFVETLMHRPYVCMCI